MKSLEEEEIEYAISVNTNMGNHKETYQNSSRLDFIAGANSKYVQAEKIKSKLDVWRCFNYIDDSRVKEIITKLEQELKELEDGK